MSQVIAGIYEIQNKIGAGGGGIVYMGRHTRLEKRVVLKADKRTLDTDVNVDAATDFVYDLTERVKDVSASSTGSQTLVSQGEYAEFKDIYLDGVKLVAGTDYTSESGSTRITISNQTLAKTSKGTHTLGVEFRTEDTDTLKRAAQNYVVNGVSGGENEDGGNSGNTSNDGNDESGSSTNGSGNSSSNKSKGNKVSPSVTKAISATANVSYTIQPGDTLWKIAENFYGKGWHWRKIYQANEDIITAPEEIYVGQVIVIPK